MTFLQITFERKSGFSGRSLCLEVAAVHFYFFLGSKKGFCVLSTFFRDFVEWVDSHRLVLGSGTI